MQNYRSYPINELKERETPHKILNNFGNSLFQMKNKNI